jgi:tetratricopeptide (TPR) repeat protein
LLLFLPGTIAAEQLSPSELNNRGVIEAQAGRFDVGVDYLRRALQLNPSDEQVRKNLSGMLTDWANQFYVKGDMASAETLLQEAISHQPDNGFALVQLGDLAYFQRSEFDKAIELWTRANGKVPPDVWHLLADRITQAQRDRTVERTFNAVETPHFRIRIQNPKHPAVAALGQQLEDAYRQLHTTFGNGPPQVTVIVYSAQDLQRLYNQRDWAIGFYDGRLRLRWNEVEQQEVRLFIAHELSHAFLHTLYGQNIPIWVHEGLAQLQEGDHPRTPEELRVEETVVSRTSWVPLAWLDRRFSHPADHEDVMRAYVQARWVMNQLVARYGIDRLKIFLSRLSQGDSIDTAFDHAFAPSRWARANQGLFD